MKGGDTPSPTAWYTRWRPHVPLREIPACPTKNVPHGDIIDCDVPRTKLTASWDVDAALLSHILKAYACSPLAVPYTQGMSFIAALALWVSFGSPAGTADMDFAYHLYCRMLEILGNDFFCSLVPTAFPQQSVEVPLLGLRTCVDTMRTLAASVFRSRNLFDSDAALREDAVLCVDFAACSWLPKGMVHVGPLRFTLEIWDRALLFGNISALAVGTIALISLALERFREKRHFDDSDEEDDSIGMMLNCVKAVSKHADDELQNNTLLLADAIIDEWGDLWRRSCDAVRPQLIRDATEKHEIRLIQEAWPELCREDLDRIRVNFAKDANISPHTFVARLHEQGWSPLIAMRLKNYLWPTVDDSDYCMSYAELVVALSRWTSSSLSDRLRWIFDSFVRDFGVDCKPGSVRDFGADCKPGSVPLERLVEVHRVIFAREQVLDSITRTRSCVSDPGDDTRGYARSSIACASIAGVGLEAEDRVDKFFRRLKLMSSLHFGCHPTPLSTHSAGVSFHMWYVAIVRDRVLCAALQSSLMPPSRPLLFEAEDEHDEHSRASDNVCHSCHRIKRSCGGAGRRLSKIVQRVRCWAVNEQTQGERERLADE